MNIEFHLTAAMIIGLLVSTVLPIVTGLVTTKLTHPGIKAVVLAALSAATGLLTELGAATTAHQSYDLGNGLFFALTAFLVAVAMHFGLWKPTTVADKAQSVLVKSDVDKAA